MAKTPRSEAADEVEKVEVEATEAPVEAEKIVTIEELGITALDPYPTGGAAPPEPEA